MRSINYIIVEVDSAYNNDKDIGNGINITVNTSIESVEHINRVAKVVKAPDFTMLEEGDEVIVHHNIFRLRNDQMGLEVESNYWIEDNKYFVPLTEVFMYRRGDSDWKALDPYCFVKPIEQEQPEQVQGIYVKDMEDNYKGMVKNTGVMAYVNESLKSLGVSDGDTIAFSNYSEYEFTIDGELYYKMATKDIIGIYK
ncbi:MAG: hypothetical protein HRU18_03570 [Pseudoalteromonas sp.]|uniref:hypothetical protein n=1 Tax=Pseudoalteromonas sp. TaxID=53249 RepID=UPI001D7CAA13|nr:hypothetical protein [Pseudoalteromonas sp.]NRA77265.1 hypothetical protein [Pseudoalteromonas sp.]